MGSNFKHTHTWSRMSCLPSFNTHGEKERGRQILMAHGYSLSCILFITVHKLNTHNHAAVNCWLSAWLSMGHGFYGPDALPDAQPSAFVRAWDRLENALACASPRRELTGVLCDNKVPTRLKMLLYKVCIWPAMLYGNEIWPLTQYLEDRLSSSEMRMLCYIHGISLEEHRGNEEIPNLAQAEAVGVLMRKRRMEWYGHVCRRDVEEDIRRVSSMSVEGKRKRGRPRHTCRWMDTIQSDMKVWNKWQS